MEDQKKQGSKKKQNLRIKKKTNKDIKKIVDFIVKLVERRQVRGSKKKSDSKLMKTYGNLEDQKKTNRYQKNKI